MSDLLRANKITTSFVGEGVMQGTFYKTHDKLVQVTSADEAVVNAGFALVVAEGEELSSSDKLAQFKDWLQANATLFGVFYDTVDRRSADNKFPSTYNEENLVPTAQVVLIGQAEVIVEKAQRTLDAMIKNKQLAEGTSMSVNIGDGEMNIQETYANGNLKYADVKFPVEFSVEGHGSVEVTVPVKLVSGQVSKPRELQHNEETLSFTITTIKTILGLGVKKASKEDEVAEEKADEEVAVAEEAPVADAE